MTKEEFSNLDIGETFILGCRKFKVVEIEDGCNGCFFDDGCGFESGIGYELQGSYLLPECAKCYRKDKKNVIFKEVEEK